VEGGREAGAARRGGAATGKRMERRRRRPDCHRMWCGRGDSGPGLPSQAGSEQRVAAVAAAAAAAATVEARRWPCREERAAGSWGVGGRARRWVILWVRSAMARFDETTENHMFYLSAML